MRYPLISDPGFMSSDGLFSKYIRKPVVGPGNQCNNVQVMISLGVQGYSSDHEKSLSAIHASIAIGESCIAKPRVLGFVL